MFLLPDKSFCASQRGCYIGRGDQYIVSGLYGECFGFAGTQGFAGGNMLYAANLGEDKALVFQIVANPLCRVEGDQRLRTEVVSFNQVVVLVKQWYLRHSRHYARHVVRKKFAVRISLDCVGCKLCYRYALAYVGNGYAF